LKIIILLKVCLFFRHFHNKHDEDSSAKIERLKLIPPLSAMGFFLVNRETLTSVLGTIVTYFIILIQFQSGDNKNQ
jgi:hypothetical protein